MTAPKDTLPVVSTKGEPEADAQPTDRPVTVTVLAPFQVYWNQVAHVGGERVALPADVVGRYVLAGWVALTE